MMFFQLSALQIEAALCLNLFLSAPNSDAAIDLSFDTAVWANARKHSRRAFAVCKPSSVALSSNTVSHSS